MKKKLTLIVVAVVLVAAIAIGGTLAYFTDTDDATNVFTTGNVSIDLLEKQRDGEGGFEDFEQGKKLVPIVGSAQGEKDEHGMPIAANYVDKIVSVGNTGTNDAWVRIILAIPVDLSNPADKSPAQNILHWNYGSYQKEDGTWATTYASKWDWFKKGTKELNYVIASDDTGRTYEVYTTYYNTVLGSYATTENAIIGFYLDKNLDCSVDENGDTTWIFTYKKDGETKTMELAYDISTITVPVIAQAIQADGFDNYFDAFAASGLPTLPEGMTIVTTP